MSEREEREAFEKWARDRGYRYDELSRCTTGIVSPEYYNLNTENAWQAWQARASQPALAQGDVRQCLAFFASVIKSGEPWTDECQRMYDAALSAQREQQKCGTCNDVGMVGGLLPGDGGYQSDPCPDCAEQPQIDWKRRAETAEAKLLQLKSSGIRPPVGFGEFVPVEQLLAAEQPNDVAIARHGCYCDLEPDMQPDGCVLDDGLPENCAYTKHINDKTECKYWLQVTDENNRKFGVIASDRTQEKQPQGVVVPIMTEVERILSGIDREDDTDGGWWETSTGAEFGREKLEELRALLGQREG